MKPNHTLVLAEAGVNHNGDVQLAHQLVDVAVDAGADIVKFQTFQTEALASKRAPKADYQKVTTGTSESQFDMLKKLELSPAAHFDLKKRCEQKGIEFLSTPFDLPSLRFLVNELKVSRLKVASGELNNAPMLLQMALSGLPIFVSSGMSTIGDMERVLGVLAFGYLRKSETPGPQAFRAAFLSDEGQAALQNKVTLLHCTSEYPSPFAGANLRCIETMARQFQLPVGLSDHSHGIAVPTAAVALGACAIEKHFTLDKNMPGPDHRASLEPAELKAMVTSIREVEQALGRTAKRPISIELRNQAVAQKSLVAARPILKGERFSKDNLTVKRPAGGIEPALYWQWLGKEATKDFEADEVISG